MAVSDQVCLCMCTCMCALPDSYIANKLHLDALACTSVHIRKHTPTHTHTLLHINSLVSGCVESCCEEWDHSCFMEEGIRMGGRAGEQRGVYMVPRSVHTSICPSVSQPGPLRASTVGVVCLVVHHQLVVHEVEAV